MRYKTKAKAAFFLMFAFILTLPLTSNGFEVGPDVSNAAAKPNTAAEQSPEVIKYYKLRAIMRTIDGPMLESMVKKEKTAPGFVLFAVTSLLAFCLYLRRRFKKLYDTHWIEPSLEIGGGDLFIGIMILNGCCYIMYVITVFCLASFLKSIVNPQFYVMQRILDSF